MKVDKVPAVLSLFIISMLALGLLTDSKNTKNQNIERATAVGRFETLGRIYLFDDNTRKATVLKDKESGNCYIAFGSNRSAVWVPASCPENLIVEK